MLINYCFKNYKSYFDEAKITMQASKIKQYEDDNISIISDSLIQNNRILKSRLIFGPNSAGKSNAINSLKYARYLILNSAFASKENENIFDDPDNFILDEKAQNVPTEFKIEFSLDDLSEYFEYSFSFLDKKIISESLYKRSKGNDRLSSKKCLYKRTNSNFIKISESFKKIIDIFELNEKTLLLSLCNHSLKDGLCDDGKKCYLWFANILFANADTNTFDIYDKNPEYLEIATELIKLTDPSLQSIICKKEKLDLGISDYKNISEVVNALEKHKTSLKGGLRFSDDGLYTYDLCTTYNKIKINGEQEDVVWSIFENSTSVSAGVKKLIIYLAPIIKALKEGGVVLVDEIDTALHYLYSKLILELFNSKNINKKGGQGLFTSHNLKLMDERVRNDQLLLVSKDYSGKSKIEQLYDTNSRIYKNHKKSERYLQGYYLGIINIDIKLIEDLF